MKYILVLLLIQLGYAGIAQDNIVTIDNAIQRALEGNPSIKVSTLETVHAQKMKSNAWEVPKTDVSFVYGQYNSIQKNDNNLTITQSIPFPTVFTSQNSLNKSLITSFELKEQVVANEVTFQVKQLFYGLLYFKALRLVLLQQDSLLSDLVRAVSFQYKAGESTLLERTSAETQLYELKNQITRNEYDIKEALDQLKLVCQDENIIDVIGDEEGLLSQPEIIAANIDANPSIIYTSHQVSVTKQFKKVEVARVWPELKIGYFNQSLIGFQTINGQDRYFGSSKRFQGFQFGIAVPLFLKPYLDKVKAASVAEEISEKQREAQRLSINQQYMKATQELVKNRNSLDYYRESALKTATLLATQSLKAFKSGDLDYTSHLLNLRQSLAIREGYLQALQQYNQSILTIQYLNGNK